MKKELNFLLILFLVIICGLLWNYRHSVELKKNGVVTTGKIIGLRSGSAAGDFILEYEYLVNQNINEGSVQCSFFKCEDGTIGCKGKNVKVIYSNKKPNVSDIDLGINNSKKGRRLYY